MKRKHCKETRELAETYHQNLLDSDSTLRVDAHLSECPSCREDYEKTKEMLTLLKLDSLSDPGPAFWNNLSSRIMTQVRLYRPKEKEAPWYKKVWTNPFGWPGYAWATALILMLLTPVAIYNIHFQGKKAPSALEMEIKGGEPQWETGPLPLSVAVDSLSDNESVRLAKRVIARLGKDLTAPTLLPINDEVHWDISRSLED